MTINLKKWLVHVTAALLVAVPTAGFLGAHSASAAGVASGSVSIVDDNGNPLTGGGSITNFVLRPSSGAACAGDSANAGWRIQSFMVSSNVAVGALTFPLDESTGVTFRQYLFSAAGGSQFQNVTTAAVTGALLDTPAFNLSVFGETDVPAGVYTLGYYCTKNRVGDRYWSTQITVTADPTDAGPAKLHWTAGVSTPTTTTTVAPTTTAATTTAAPTTAAPTTTAATTTTSGSETTAAETTSVATSILATGSTDAAGGPTTTSADGSGGVLGSTGWNSGILVLLAALLVSSGVAAVRLARRPMGYRKP